MKKIIYLFVMIFFVNFSKSGYAFKNIQECVQSVISKEKYNQINNAKSIDEKKRLVEEFKNSLAANNKSAVVSIPLKLDACYILFDYNVKSSTKLGVPGPGELPVCCNCTGWCIAGWVFGYCSTCETQPPGGLNCCSRCNMPAGPGQTCK
ncbi:hypothetical protein [Fluviispira multicolorata]|uniref:Uncharacterized protein n=1 Tax=Fluviispira multicolorata TaxID=2654512 RepID=A0A833JGY7_9BACT|nr:hypothetical protein [Fluviispira multicolorata]KAB8033192.1 hypothetical protein GCL57_00410 [Fluviispira multicolorata]